MGTLIQQHQQRTPLQLSHICPFNVSLLSAHTCVPPTKVSNHEQSLNALSHVTFSRHHPISCRSNLGVVTEVAKSLEFAPAMHALAARVISGMAATAPEYNAVHLRIEKDARDWSQIMGGPEVCLCTYTYSSPPWSP